VGCGAGARTTLARHAITRIILIHHKKKGHHGRIQLISRALLLIVCLPMTGAETVLLQ
jgi:hypothetical protein